MNTENDDAEQARSTRVIAALHEQLPAEAIATDAAIAARHATDWTGHCPTRPAAVISPRTTEHVATMLAICHAHGQPVVPQGGLSGLAGGAVPGNRSDIALSLGAMDHIEDIDTAAATITVQAGATLARVQQAAEAADFRFPLDFAARDRCQIGGLIATNAGGVSVVRHGTMRAQVLGLEVVLADGRVLTDLKPMLKNNTGLDLKQCFIGSEGTLGVVTRAMLRLAPPKGTTTIALIATDAYADAIALLHTLGRGGLGLESFELMWRDFYAMSLAWHPEREAPLAAHHGLYILCEIEGPAATARECIAKACRDRGLTSWTIADSAAAAERLWSIRYATAEFPQRLAPINFDISLPIGDIGIFVEQSRAALETEWPGLQAVYFGHIGDSNLHLTVDGQSLDEDTPATRHAIEDCVYALTARYGGSISAEHGIGLLKKPYLHYSVDTTARTLMTGAKGWLDPKGILNPGKVIDRLDSGVSS
ncbi:FAD-binding oxidoreductase [Salinisphaera sp. SPP-AMP-43]|uniref:FAD-binding oxidoreductase n=1 Tax=Salinisphaera sp. SPP-AMP-43 TaxID=3121288 RepID=UPI003C6E55C9